MSKDSDIWATFDQDLNDASRLPAEEAVHLGGITLVEAFTPSTIGALYQALDDLPVGDPDKKREWLSELKASRGAPHGGWQSLGMVRPPGKFIGVNGFHDSALPKGVEAVWLELHYQTASLAMVVATFTFDEESGDLSPLLRRDYQTEVRGAHIHVPGRMGGLRARIPWARPKSYRVMSDVRNVDAQKQEACEKLASQHEDECWRWFAKRFPGRFATEPVKDRPSARLIFTQSDVPFKGRPGHLRPIGLTDFGTVWRSPEANGWAMKFSDELSQPRRKNMILVAARRSDAAREHGQADDRSVWSLTQTFHRYHSSLMVRWTMISLISLYSDRLGALRDRAGHRKRFRRPVRQALELDSFLLGDGLDASTVASDIGKFTDVLKHFRWNVVEYTEDQEGYPQEVKDKHEPLELVPLLCESIGSQAKRLREDMAATIANVGASAQLRQAVANTRLQRGVILLTVAAVVIAVISLVASAPTPDR